MAMVKINLFQMRRLIRETVKVQWRLEQEQAKATKITTVLTGMPRASGNHSQVEDGAIRLADLQEAYAEVLSDLHDMRAVLDPLIDELENADDRAVMRLRYIKGFSPEDIAEAIHRSDRSIYYYLSRAENEICRKHPDKVRANG
jgi:DNA-directed RNA polymerase specialized sigma24 family protein